MAALLCSVIIPAYNSEKYIEKTLQSIINQTYREIEIIVINDCSSDSTSDIVKRFMEFDSRVILIDNDTNMGVSHSRNKAILSAKGEYIAFCDSDDYWDINKLEMQMDAITNSNCSLCCTARELIMDDGQPTGHVLPVTNTITYEKLLADNIIACSSVVLKREIALEFPMERSDLHEDFIIWLTIIKKYGPACGINQPLLKYRLTANSKSSGKIKTLKMRYGVYKFIGINNFRSYVFILLYMISALRKYGRHWRLK
jgi:teichuronic acid biosynthesis glycosyltransferase TuaG